ncbi:NEL-type E3 ubiquitin ligase domain-containing protein [Pseudomonas sp. NPDC096950]|uniref:NEL-type E3 ubiquitin ligase domain-containing protein n=1 Tax=Pseudomonas sp. NPDC096950 TaxID=3364485 RepID=UPI00383BC24A
MLTTQTPAPARRPLSHTETLIALLEATGDLDIAETLHKGLPAWLLKASPTVLAALDTDTRELLVYQQKFELLMQKLQPLDTFCASQLSSALTRKWSVAFDVNHDALVLPGFDCGCEGASTTTEGVMKIPSVRRSLLQAAMQNFTTAETEKDGFPAESTVDVASSPKGLTGLTPQAFATLCRELDLGQRYQDHIREVFQLPTTSDGLVNDLKWLKIKKLRVDAHLAFMKEHLTEAAYKTLLTLNTHSGTGSETGIQKITHGSEPLIIQGMELFGTCVWGVVVFSKRSVETYPNEWCVVYMPNEPGRPLYEYKTFAEFKLYLGLKLKVNSYKDYFAHGIEEDHKLEFFKSAAQASNLDTFKALPITVPLSQFLIQSALGKMQIDARELAVPTADVDEEARKQRLQSFIELGLTVANVAAFFVPVLGQLMIGVSVGMVLAEVYDGVQDWQHGDKQEALSHLLSVAENLALLGAFAVGGKVIGALVKKTVREHPAFFSQFESMTHSSGKPRLWKTDLQPYKRPLGLLSGRAADAEGVYQVDGHPHIRIDDSAYRIHYDPTLKKWRVRHFSRDDAFSPVLEHNGERGWRLAFEQPHQWREGSYALKRADSRLAALEDSRLETIRRVTGTSVPDLHHLNEESLVLSARLKDCIERFRLDQRLRDCIAALEKGDPRSAVHASEHLQALPSMSGWPAGRYIRVLGRDQKVSAVYPKTARVTDEELAVDVTETDLAQGKLFEKVVAGLYQTEVDTLIGAKTSTEKDVDALAKKLSAALKQDRVPLFNRLYQLHDVSTASDVELVRKEFAQLPVDMAQELIDQASSVERLRLRANKRVPMGLAQKSREGVADVQLDRAISGLSLPEIASGDSENLALALLEHLRGWDRKMLLEVREGSITGNVLHSIRREGSVLKRTVVKSAAGYQAFGSDGKSLGPATKGPDALYEAIVQALPTAQRTAMGLGNQLPAQARLLRGQLLARATEERAQAARLLVGKPLEIAAPAACIQADPPLPSATHPRALLRKVKKLYPLLTDKQLNTLLDGLGTDHLTRATAVKQRKTQLETLRGVLKTWRNDDANMRKLPGDWREYQQSRRQVANAIENSWRRMVLLRNEQGNDVPGLNLDGMRVGKLPTLPADIDFSHVQRLSLKGMQQGDDMVHFLKSFKGIESLELDGNQITALPDALALMPKLIHLSLANNRLRLSETTLVKLAAMRSLESLNLSKNALGATPDVTKMFDLRLLALRDTGATELPKGLVRLPHLNFVDLRENNIRTLPDWLFEAPTRFSKSINLRTNTLDDASRIKLETYRDSTGVGMGYFDDDIARMNEQSAKALWLPEETRVTYTRRGEIWNAFRDDPQSESLFQLLAELGNTADSEYVREDMTRRVWSVLEAAYGDAALRDQVLNQAANPINCTDTAAMNFSNLEVAVEVDKVRRLSGTTADSAKPLLQLGRVLFRIERLNAIALEHKATHPAVDPLEANLAYRTGLAEDLELPGQPKYMRFSSLGDVTATDIAAAKNQILAAELSPALRTSLAKQFFWVDYLKQYSPKAFSAMNAPFQTRLSEVFEKAETLKDADYRAQVEAINKDRDLSEMKLLERLTDETMKRVDLGLCAIAEV